MVISILVTLNNDTDTSYWNLDPFKAGSWIQYWPCHRKREDGEEDSKHKEKWRGGTSEGDNSSVTALVHGVILLGPCVMHHSNHVFWKVVSSCPAPRQLVSANHLTYNNPVVIPCIFMSVNALIINTEELLMCKLECGELSPIVFLEMLSGCTFHP